MEVQHRDDSKRRLAGNGASQIGSTAVNTTSASREKENQLEMPGKKSSVCDKLSDSH